MREAEERRDKRVGSSRFVEFELNVAGTGVTKL
jgi:hypothetical protein